MAQFVVAWGATEWALAALGVAATSGVILAHSTTGGRLANLLGQAAEQVCPQGGPQHSPPGDDEKFPCPAWLWNGARVRGINWAILGDPGTGKSTLNNTLRGLRARDEGAAQVGVTETTAAPTPYALPDSGAFASIPNRDSYRFWDIPGAGTPDQPADTYVSEMGLRHFDAVILVIGQRFTEVALTLLVHLRRFRVPVLLVRNKVDQDIDNQMQDHGWTRDQTLTLLRADLASRACIDVGEVFLIAAGRVLGPGNSEPLILDFLRLEEALVHCTLRGRCAGPFYWENRELENRPAHRHLCPIRQDWAMVLLRQSDHCGRFSRAEVIEVQRNENAALYKEFLQMRTDLTGTYQDGVRSLQPAIDAEFLINGQVNEVFLWHGTGSTAMETILRRGFDERVASVSGNLYGSGLYFASQSCKSLQYASRGTERCLILCRVLLGNVFYATGPIDAVIRRPPCVQGCPHETPCPHERHDSVVANSGVQHTLGAQVHREFVVHNRRQVYPEFLIKIRMQ